MKKWLLIAFLLGAAVLSRLPGSARDVAKLEPVEVVWLRQEGESLVIETDTGAKGVGKTLTEAAGDMRDRACGEIFLDTAGFLLLAPDIPITREYDTLFRPDCRVAFIREVPDLEKAATFLHIHQPPDTLASLRLESAGAYR